MSDLISREEAKKAYCKTLCCPGAFCPDGMCKEVNETFDAVPSADLDIDGFSKRLWKAAYERGKRDAIPVQCEDCKHYDIFPNGANGICKKNVDARVAFYPWDFCSKGERRNDE